MKMTKFKQITFDAFGFTFLGLVILAVIFKPDEEAMLNLERNFLITISLFILSCLLSYFLKKKKIITWGVKLFPLPTQKNFHVTKWYQEFWAWQMLATLLVSFIIAFIKTRFSIYELFDEAGFQGAVRLFQALLHPNWEVLPRAVLNIIETIFMAFLATALAIPFAFVLSFLSAKNIMKSPFAFTVYLILRTLLNVTRSIEALIWAIIFTVWVGIGPFAGMMALFIHSIVSLAKQYSEMVESVQEGPIEGIQATGANQLQTIWYAIVPQVILPYISFTVYRWDINVRMATIIGLVGGGGIGTMLQQYQGQAMWNEVGCIIFVIAVVVWVMDQASAVIREVLK